MSETWTQSLLFVLTVSLGAILMALILVIGIAYQILNRKATGRWSGCSLPHGSARLRACCCCCGRRERRGSREGFQDAAEEPDCPTGEARGSASLSIISDGTLHPPLAGSFVFIPGRSDKPSMAVDGTPQKPQLGSPPALIVTSWLDGADPCKTCQDQLSDDSSSAPGDDVIDAEANGVRFYVSSEVNQ